MNKLFERLIIGVKENGLAWAETCVVALIAIYVWIHSDSLAPNSTEHNFFWPVLGPLLISLRYGFVKGFICALMTITGLALLMKFTGILDYFPFSLAVGTVLTAMIAGEFRDHWNTLTQKHIFDYKYMKQKLDGFTQSYHLLKISHDQLEQRIAGQKNSLRTAINALQKIAAEHSDRRLEFLGEPLLNLLADIGGLQVASVYKVTNGKIETNSYATLGDQHKLDMNDPMLQDMLSTKKLLSQAVLDANEEHKSRYQLCIPLLDTSGKLQAVVLAERAKFFLLTPANIALLSLVSNYAADLLSDELLTPTLKQHQANIFSFYMKRAHYYKRYYGADSSIVIFVDSTGKYLKALESILNYRRGVDVYWTCNTKNNHPALMVLLPLTTSYEAYQYIERVKELLNDYIKNDVDLNIIGPLSLDKDQKIINQFMEEGSVVY